MDFNSTEIVILKNTIIHNCSIIALADLKQASLRAKTYLVQPWANFARTVVIESYLDNLVDPKCWLEWEPRRKKKCIMRNLKIKGLKLTLVGGFSLSKAIQNSFEEEMFMIKRFIHGKHGFPKMYLSLVHYWRKSFNFVYVVILSFLCITCIFSI
ncbi:hypothetical protein M9H77_16158 [Catharanthus roseus]|uniref:Uncharacterized protein n=1 Tax=Catharanthus roseus TaxID=4058 RepID=A0ACC0B0M9_CATRO|nr:hypothetical protein M9H77_16158 [Catharanthus roseus]